MFGLRMALGVFVAKGIPVGIGSAGGRGGVFAAAGVPVPGGGVATPGGTVCAGGSCPASAAGGMIVSTVASRKPAMKAYALPKEDVEALGVYLSAMKKK